MIDGVVYAQPADTPRTHITVRLIAQDPTVRGDDGRLLTADVKVPWSRMEDGPRGSRLHVVDYDAGSGVYRKHPGIPNEDPFVDATDDELLDDPAFHAQQVYAVAAKTLALFETALGRRLPWGFGGHHLALVPHAFAEANAYYSAADRALLFGYVPAVDDERPVYTCLSHDVVVHETSHAILDGLRRRFLERGLPDQAAFHEGFADIVALLSVFSMRPVVEQCLGVAGANGRIAREKVTAERLKSSVLTSVAEQFGRVLTQGRGPLRRSAMTPPPPDWADLPQYTEPHRRGEVLVAIVLDVLVDIWVRRLEALFSRPGYASATLDRARAAEEGTKAATQLLTMLIRGLDYLPPVEFEFSDLLDAVLLADVEVVPDDDLGYRRLLIERFARAGIHRSTDCIADILDAEIEPTYLGINHAALRTDLDEVFRFLWQNAPRLGISTRFALTVESVLPSQRIGPDGLLVSETVSTYLQTVELTAGDLEEISELPVPRGVSPDTPVRIFGGGTLVFDQYGRLKLHVAKRIDDWRRQLRRVEHLHRTTQSGAAPRLGFSDDADRGRSFAELHDTQLITGETW